MTQLLACLTSTTAQGKLSVDPCHGESRGRAERLYRCGRSTRPDYAAGGLRQAWTRQTPAAESPEYHALTPPRSRSARNHVDRRAVDVPPRPRCRATVYR